MDKFPTLKQQMGKRLAQVRDNAGKSQTEFAATLNVSVEVYAAYEAGEIEIPVNVMHSLHDHNIDVSWLMTGEGQPYWEPTLASA